MALMATTSRPRIGVTGPDHGGRAAWLFTRLAVWLAGGRARRITPSRPAEIEALDGLIIGGGADVDPAYYGRQREALLDGAEPESSLRGRLTYLLSLLLYPLIYLMRKLFSRKRPLLLDAERDALEFRLLEAAVEQRIPVLGICRGAQLLNIHFQGSLYQNIRGFYSETPQVRSILPRKRIFLRPGSSLAQVLNAKTCKVNALHDQAIENLGKGLVAVAWEQNRLVQAIEHPDHPCLLGVQWHPEYLPQKAEQRAIFRRLVQTAGR